jgi:ATP-dependent protease ClpP protease subunit
MVCASLLDFTVLSTGLFRLHLCVTKAQAMPKTSEVKLYAFIGQAKNGYDKAPYMTGAQVDAMISAANADPETDEVLFSVNSGGGDVMQGNIIISSLQKCTKPTTAVIDGFAASMGYFVCLGANKILASKNAMIMPHGVQSAISGSVQEIEAHVEVVKKFNQSMATLLTARTGLTEDEVIAKYLSADTWLTAQEALELKLLDGITDYESDMVDMPVASMSYGEFYAAYSAKLSEEPAEDWFAKMTAKVGAYFGIAPKAAKPTAIVVELSDSEEYSLQSIINYLSYANECADYVCDQTSNPALKELAKKVLSATSQFIIDSTVMLYTEESADASGMEARVKTIRADFAAKQTGTIMAAIKSDIDSQVSAVAEPLKAQLAEITLKYNAVKDLPAATASGIKTQVILSKNPVIKAIDENTSLTEDGKVLAKLNTFDFATARVDNN